jgi:hypothetical protein
LDSVEGLPLGRGLLNVVTGILELKGGSLDLRFPVYLSLKSAHEDLTMAFNNNKGENGFPFEIKEAEGDVREQFIKDFHGKLKEL